MKKYLQGLLILVLTLTIVGIANNSPAWASALSNLNRPSARTHSDSETVITQSGSYTIGGLCQFNVVYTGSGASAKVAIDVPAEDSRAVPNSSSDQLYLAGCHVIHYTLGQVVREMSPAYGSWEICFGDRLDRNLTIYYYLDNPENGSAVWLPLTTTVKNGSACAPANFTGVYAPGGKPLNASSDNSASGGTVRPPTPTVTGVITKSGTYNVGGICSIIIDFRDSSLSVIVHVEKNTDISANVPFPDNAGLLQLPGCHVIHYKGSELLNGVNPDQGSWKICFASLPNTETTIYFYGAKDDLAGSVTSDWTPVETTLENGMACAPSYSTGVYAPATK